MKDIDALFFVEHPARELDIAAAVRCLAEEKFGLHVEVRSFVGELYQSCFAFRPKVIVVPYFYASDNWLISDILRFWPDMTFLNLNFEQLFFSENAFARRPRGSLPLERVHHWSWGPFFRQYLESHGVRSDLIHDGGNPTYQLYQHPFRDFYPDRAVLAKAFDLDPTKKWLLFTENYGWAFLPRENFEQKIKEGFDREKAEAYLTFNRESLAAATRVLTELAESGDYQIIFRPRPAVSLSDYRARLGEICDLPEAFRVIKAGTAREWVLAADLVVSSVSTTLLEAVSAGVPACIFEPLPFPDWLHWDWYQWLPKARNKNDLVDGLESPHRPQWVTRARVAFDQKFHVERSALHTLTSDLAVLCNLNRQHSFTGDFNRPVPVDRITCEQDHFGQEVDLLPRIERWRRILFPA